MPDPIKPHDNPRGIFNLGRLDAKQQAALMTEVRACVHTITEEADKGKAQDLLETIWEICGNAEPNIATMALMLAAFTARSLSMFADGGLAIPVAVPALSMLTAMITDQQMAADEEHAGAGHA